MRLDKGDKVTFGPFPSISKEKTLRRPVKGGKFSVVKVNPRRPMLGTIVEVQEITDRKGNPTGEFYYHIEDSCSEWIWKVREIYVRKDFEDFSSALDLAEELPEIVKTYLGYNISAGKGSKGPDGKYRDLNFSIDSWRITLNETASYIFYDKNVAIEYYEEQLALFEKYIKHMHRVESIPQIDKISTNIPLETLLKLFKDKGISMAEIHHKYRGVSVGKNVGIL